MQNGVKFQGIPAAIFKDIIPGWFGVDLQERVCHEYSELIDTIDEQRWIYWSPQGLFTTFCGQLKRAQICLESFPAQRVPSADNKLNEKQRITTGQWTLVADPVFSPNSPTPACQKKHLLSALESEAVKFKVCHRQCWHE